MATQSHESLTSFRRVEASSDRKFGITVGLILCAIALWPIVRHHASPRIWLLIIGAALVALGVVAPRVLAPLNKAWLRLGLLLATITNPIVMGAMYFLAVVPFGVVLRKQGRDLLSLKKDPQAASYWIERDPNEKTSLAKQF